MPLNLRPHQYRRQPNTDRAVLTGLSPYVRLSREGDDNPPVFIQGGQFWDASGNEILEASLPEWVHEELTKLTPRTRKEVGLPDPEPDPEED